MAAIKQNRSVFKWFGGIFLFLSVIIGLCCYIMYAIYTISNYNSLNAQIDKILLSSNKSTIAAKEFLMNAYTDEEFVKTGTNESFRNFNVSMNLVETLSGSLRNSWFINTPKRKEYVKQLDLLLHLYKRDFLDMAGLYKRKGFKDLGLEGKMRAAIHAIENSDADLDRSYMLTLRRHEKDFLLRKDLSYVKKFKADLDVFRIYIEEHQENSDSTKMALLSSLQTYEMAFQDIVRIEKTIGLLPKTGLHYSITSKLYKIENILLKLDEEIQTARNMAASGINIVITATLFLFILIVTGCVLGVRYFIEAVSKPLDRLNNAAMEISQGNLSIDLHEIKSKRLMGSLVASFERIVLKMKDTIFQIEMISSRKLNTLISLHNEHDEIGESLNGIITELRSVDEEEKRRVWTSEGITRLGEVIRIHSEIKPLCDELVSMLVKYLGANQAGLFIVSDKRALISLELISAYAYERKKYLVKEIEIGEGLVGQCFLEKDTIYMNDIPQDYVRITSGLGDASPTAILVVPLKSSETQVEGVLEMATFHDFNDFQISFVEKACEIIASTLSIVRINQKTKQLLEETQIQAEMMKAQEEEMRQSMEEMMASQEEIQRKEQAYLVRISVLEQELEVVKAQTQKLAKESSRLDFVFKAKQMELIKNQVNLSDMKEGILDKTNKQAT